MAGDPIRIGSASGSTLVPGIPSRIITDEFGVQHGVVPYQIGDQSLSQGARITPGTLYSGSLSQFNGFFVERSGDITGREAGCAIIDIQYAQIDPKFIVLPTKGHDLQILAFPTAELTGFNQILETLTTITVPLVHPLLTYKFAANSIPGKLGQYGTPANAPSIGQYTYNIEIINFVNGANVDVETKTVSYNATVLTSNPDGTCTKTTSPVSVKLQALFVVNSLSFINPTNIVFAPNPAGWQCIKEDAQAICGGQIYLIEQQWKMTMVWAGLAPGTFWSNAIPVHCT